MNLPCRRRRGDTRMIAGCAAARLRWRDWLGRPECAAWWNPMEVSPGVVGGPRLCIRPVGTPRRGGTPVRSDRPDHPQHDPGGGRIHQREPSRFLVFHLARHHPENLLPILVGRILGRRWQDITAVVPACEPLPRCRGGGAVPAVMSAELQLLPADYRPKWGVDVARGVPAGYPLSIGGR